MGTNITLTSGNATWDGSIADTINSTDTDTQLNLTGGAGIDIQNTGGLNRTITTDNDGTTINNSGGTGTQNQVLKVPNTLQITDSSGASITYDGSVARTITINDNDNQLNLTEGNGITITNTGGLNRTIAVNADGTTLSDNVGSGQAGVLKVPNTLTKGTNISFINTTDGAVETTYDGSTPITISSSDTDTTYQGGSNISIDTTTNPDTINLDSAPTNLDLSSATNTFPLFVGGSEILKSMSYIDNSAQNFNSISNSANEYFFSGSQTSGSDTLEIDFTATSTTGYCEYGFYANTSTGGMIFCVGIAAATGGTSPFSTTLTSSPVSIDAYKIGLFDGTTSTYSLKEILDFTSFENTYITSKFFFNNLSVGTRYRMALYGRCFNSGSIIINAGGKNTTGFASRSFHQPSFMKFYEYDSSIGGARTTGGGGGGGGDDY